MTIRWIVFDVVGTLLAPTPSVGAIYHEIGRRFGSGYSQAELEARFHAAFKESDFAKFLPVEAWSDPAQYQTDEVSERRIWSNIVTSVLDDVRDREACFSEIFDRFAKAESWRLLPRVERGIKALKDAGYRLAVASNFDARLHHIMDGIPALRLIEQRVISSEVGYHKPSLHFFRNAEKLLGAQPLHIIMVGDSMVNDVQGARNAGWRAVQITHKSQVATPPSNDDCIRSFDDIEQWMKEIA